LRNVVGMVLWAVMFVPLATLGIQPRLDSFTFSAPNQHKQLSWPLSRIVSHYYRRIIGVSLGIWRIGWLFIR
jgi:hypothetical protein